MKRPPGFRVETWDYITTAHGAPTYAEMQKTPGSLAIACGLIDHPKLIVNTVIELPDGCEYVLRDSAAMGLSTRKPHIIVERLYDKKLHQISYVNLVAAIEDVDRNCGAVKEAHRWS